jgi:flagellar hook-length control protein FliK
VENSTLKLFGLLQSNAVENASNNNKNQSVNNAEAAGVFKQLLAIQTQLKSKTELSEGVKGLPLVGKQLPEGVLKQLEQLEESDLAMLAEQIVTQEYPNVSQFPGLSGSTELTSVIDSSPVIAQLASQLAADEFSGSKADVIRGPWTDKQLMNAQAFVGSKEVADEVLKVTTKQADVFSPSLSKAQLTNQQSQVANPQLRDQVQVVSQPSSVASIQLRDEDLLATAKQASVIQLEAARQKSLTATESPREVVENLLRQVEGKLRAKVQSSVTAGTPSGNKVTTADTFLMNRSVFKANASESVMTRTTQFEALLGSARSESASSVSAQASTLNFLNQRGINNVNVDTDSSRAPASTPLTLSTSDTAQHATEQLQRTAGAFRDQLMTPQNEERLQKAVGERIMRMVESGNWDTEMELNPARLGTIRIRLSMEGSELQVAMSSQNAGVRDLLEASMPRLRDGLSDSGIALANSTVDQELSQQSGGSQKEQEQQAEAVAVKAKHNSDDIVGQSAQQSSHDGELDTFA